MVSSAETTNAARPDPQRYLGHGDLQLTQAERALLKSVGFEPWGNHGWVLFALDGSEQGGTCYDDKWAMQEAISSLR